MAKRAPRLITGRVSVHRDGYGFLTPDAPVEGVTGDIFLPPDAAAKAMHGDLVGVKITGFDRRGRVEGDITRVIERANSTLVGTFRMRRNGMFVRPIEDRIREWIEIPEGMAMPKGLASVDRIGAQPRPIQSPADLNGLVVNVELIEYPDKHGTGVGRVIEVLGAPDDFGVDVEIMIRKHRIPDRFPPQVIEEARAIPDTISIEDLSGRRDFREMDVVTIDGETARDFDDAVWVERLPSGNYALHVHIADVSHFVRPGSEIDREATVRGTSVYFPDRAVPMLPIELSTEICSLKPRQDRLVMSALLEIDHRGDVVQQEFVRGIIRSAERMTYTHVHAVLEGEPGLREKYAALVNRFELMRELALLLNRKRTRRGSIDFDLPEAVIEFDEFGEMTAITRGPRNIAHRIIEEFMLAANEAVAETLEQAGEPAIYRIHEKPDPKRVMEFEEIAAQFGVSLGIGALPVKRHRVVNKNRDGSRNLKDVVVAGDIQISPRNYQKLVAKIAGRPEERILSYLMLRSLKQARYSANNDGHFALASTCYTHFTSPIRRYPDLLVHRRLGELLDGSGPRYGKEQLTALADRCSEYERRAAEAERELVDWKKLKFMEAHLGSDFPGLIIHTARGGFHVELTELFVEGFVPLDALDGPWRYEDNTRRIVSGRTRQEFKIGDAIAVKLVRIDSVEKKLIFVPAKVPHGPQKKKRR